MDESAPTSPASDFPENGGVFFVILDSLYLVTLPRSIWKYYIAVYLLNLVFIISVSLNGCGLNGTDNSDMVIFFKHVTFLC